MTSFTDRFGGITVYPSDLGYQAYSITTSTTLTWPELGNTSSNLAASFIRASSTVTGAGFIMPDARDVSVGRAERIKNIGSISIPVFSASGSTLATVSAGQDLLLSVIDNSTSGGLWDTTQLGVGTSSADAAFLAGNGLTTSGSKLVANWPVYFTGSNGYQLTATSDGTVLTWTGGTGTISIAFDGGTIVNGYITAVKNYGTGVLTISGNFLDSIDGNALQLYPSDSTFIVGAGASHGYYSLGLTNGSLTGALNLTPTAATTTLTSAQATNKIFILTGQLTSFTGNTIVFPQAAAEFVIINQMTLQGTYRAGEEAFIKIQTSGGGASINIPAGSTRNVVCDGTNMYFADDLGQCRPAQNLLYWCDFSKNPWQRGSSFTSSSVSQYTADRVSMVSPSGSAYTLTRVASTTTGAQYDLRIQRISGSPAASGQVRVGFDLETVESIPLRGKPVTLAAQLNYGTNFAAANLQIIVYSNTGVNQRIVDSFSGSSLVMNLPPQVLTTNTGYYVFAINPASYGGGGGSTLSTTFSQLSVMFQYVPTITAGASDYINITRLALIDGTTFSGFDTLEYGDVTRKCQRHFAKTFPITTIPAAAASAAGNLSVGPISSSSPPATAVVVWKYPETLRTVPSTVSLFTPQTGTINAFRDSTGATVSAMADFIGDTQCVIYNTATSFGSVTRLDIHAAVSADI